MGNFVRTYKRRKIFLDLLAVGSSVSKAAAAADGTTTHFRRWREVDPEFAKDWDDAIDEGTDCLEDAAYDRAIKKSDTLAMFMLKARRPEKFDRGSKLEVSGNLNVEGSKAKLLNRIARLQAAGKLSSAVSEEESPVPEDNAESAKEEEAVKLLPAPATTAPVRGRKRRSVEQPNRRQAASK